MSGSSPGGHPHPGQLAAVTLQLGVPGHWKTKADEGKMLINEQPDEFVEESVSSSVDSSASRLLQMVTSNNHSADSNCAPVTGGGRQKHPPRSPTRGSAAVPACQPS